LNREGWGGPRVTIAGKKMGGEPDLTTRHNQAEKVKVRGRGGGRWPTPEATMGGMENREWISQGWSMERAGPMGPLGEGDCADGAFQAKGGSRGNNKWDGKGGKDGPEERSWKKKKLGGGGGDLKKKPAHTRSITRRGAMFPKEGSFLGGGARG